MYGSNVNHKKTVWQTLVKTKIGFKIREEIKTEKINTIGREMWIETTDTEIEAETDIEIVKMNEIEVIVEIDINRTEIESDKDNRMMWFMIQDFQVVKL